MMDKKTEELIERLIELGEKEKQGENKCFSSEKRREGYYTGWKSALCELRKRIAEQEAEELNDMKEELEDD